MSVFLFCVSGATIALLYVAGGLVFAFAASCRRRLKGADGDTPKGHDYGGYVRGLGRSPMGAVDPSLYVTRLTAAQRWLAERGAVRAPNTSDGEMADGFLSRRIAAYRAHIHDTAAV